MRKWKWMWFLLIAVLAAGCDPKDPMYNDPNLNDRHDKPFTGIPYSEE